MARKILFLIGILAFVANSLHGTIPADKFKTGTLIDYTNTYTSPWFKEMVQAVWGLKSNVVTTHTYPISPYTYSYTMRNFYGTATTDMYYMCKLNPTALSSGDATAVYRLLRPSAAVGSNGYLYYCGESPDVTGTNMFQRKVVWGHITSTSSSPTKNYPDKSTAWDTAANNGPILTAAVNQAMDQCHLFKLSVGQLLSSSICPAATEGNMNLSFFRTPERWCSSTAGRQPACSTCSGTGKVNCTACSGRCHTCAIQCRNAKDAAYNLYSAWSSGSRTYSWWGVKVPNFNALQSVAANAEPIRGAIQHLSTHGSWASSYQGIYNTVYDRTTTGSDSLYYNTWIYEKAYAAAYYDNRDYYGDGMQSYANAFERSGLAPIRAAGLACLYAIHPSYTSSNYNADVIGTQVSTSFRDYNDSTRAAWYSAEGIREVHLAAYRTGQNVDSGLIITAINYAANAFYSAYTYFNNLTNAHKCTTCNDTGKRTCSACNGTGKGAVAADEEGIRMIVVENIVCLSMKCLARLKMVRTLI